eukprot:3437741-Rhodomonas_salina.6
MIRCARARIRNLSSQEDSAKRSKMAPTPIKTGHNAELGLPPKFRSIAPTAMQDTPKNADAQMMHRSNHACCANVRTSHTQVQRLDSGDLLRRQYREGLRP